MPDVTGERLDIALSDIEGAGFADKVDVVGGGMFGVVDESNWQVCDQSPKSGQTISATPQLTVDRSCDDAGTNEMTAPTDAPSGPDDQPAADADLDVVTAENSPDLAAILTESDYCSDTIANFATEW